MLEDGLLEISPCVLLEWGKAHMYNKGSGGTGGEKKNGSIIGNSLNWNKTRNNRVRGLLSMGKKKGGINQGRKAILFLFSKANSLARQDKLKQACEEGSTSFYQTGRNRPYSPWGYSDGACVKRSAT